MIRVEPLSQHRASVPTIATWHFAEWGELTGATTVADYLGKERTVMSYTLT